MSERTHEALSLTEQSRVAEIVEEHGDALRRFVATRLGNSGERDDVVQEVYARLAGYGKLETIRKPLSFLFRVAENVIRDRARRAAFRQTDRHESIETQAVRDAAPRQDRIVEGKEALAAFRAALLELEPRRRQAFLLSRVDGLRYREIADRMGLSVKTIEKYIGEALAYFREHVGEAVGKGTPDASSSMRRRRT